MTCNSVMKGNHLLGPKLKKNQQQNVLLTAPPVSLGERAMTDASGWMIIKCNRCPADPAETLRGTRKIICPNGSLHFSN